MPHLLRPLAVLAFVSVVNGDNLSISEEVVLSASVKVDLSTSEKLDVSASEAAGLSCPTSLRHGVGERCMCYLFRFFR